MRKPLVVGLSAAAAAALFAGGVAYASNSGSSDQQTQHSTNKVIRPFAAIDSATETKFTAIAPCRAVDTRAAGGDLGVSEIRNFQVGGSGSFASQGGSSTGCGLPTNPVAIAATITTVAHHSGFLKAWAAGAAQPGTSFMNYGTSFNASTGGNIPVSSTGRISILNHGGPTDVILDITGYYVKPLYAAVASNGALLSGSRVTAVSKPFGAGTYEVDFDRDVSQCAYAMTAEGVPANIPFAEPRSGVPNGVYVQIGGATRADNAFTLSVTC